MTRRGLLLTLTEPPAAMEEEFNAWYDTEHLAERLSIPGFRSARRWVADLAPGEGKYLATYELDSAVRIDDYGDYVFHTVLFAIVALAILNAVMMSVLNRRREFGILQALGLTGAETGLIVFGEGLVLTLASGFVGMALGYAITWGLFADGIDFSRFIESDMSFSGGVVETTIVPMFSWTQIGLSLGFIVIIGTLSSLYPALRATRLDVAEAVKFDQ